MKQTIIIMWLITSLAYATDFDESLKLAKEGDAEAQFEAGRTYYSGRSNQEYREQALKWFKKSAEQGHSVAQFNLAVSYRKGNGVPQNDKEAFKWYRKSAEHGFSPAL